MQSRCQLRRPPCWAPCLSPAQFNLFCFRTRSQGLLLSSSIPHHPRLHLGNISSTAVAAAQGLSQRAYRVSELNETTARLKNDGVITHSLWHRLRHISTLTDPRLPKLLIQKAISSSQWRLTSSVHRITKVGKGVSVLLASGNQHLRNFSEIKL